MAAARFYMILHLALMMILGIDCVGGGEWSTVVGLRMSPEREPRPRGDGAPFKVGVFADLHFGENAWTDWGPRQDVNSVRVMEGVLDVENPDFVVYLGDLITANNMPIANASQYWDMAISPTRARGIPWASVFGNHDDAQFVWPIEWFSTGGIPPVHCSSANSSHKGAADELCSFIGTSRLELIKREIGSSRLSLSNNGPRDLWPSVSNYVLKVSSDDDSESPLAFLYFLDSGGGSYPEVISIAQVEWFENTSQKINPDSRVPEIIFWHIPSKSYNDVAPWFMILKPCVGSINKEKVAPQEAENGMMNLLTERPSVKVILPHPNHSDRILSRIVSFLVFIFWLFSFGTAIVLLIRSTIICSGCFGHKFWHFAEPACFSYLEQAVFVGHNHGLDWCCPYKKLWLCYARHTGYGGYGNWPRGARIIEITQRPFSLKSWIRMEDGSVHSQVTLSS